MNNHNPLDDLLNDEEDVLFGYDLYREEMDARFEQLDTETIAALHAEYVATGSRSARDRLVHSLLPLVPFLCKRLKASYGRPARDQWDDCIQAGNLAILQALESWSPDGGASLSSWVRRYIVRDVGRELDFLMEAAPKQCSIEDLSRADESDEGEYATAMAEATDFAAMQANIDKLTKRQQAVVNLLLSGKTVAEAAAILGIDRQRAYLLHERAIMKLRKLMGTSS